MFDMESIIVTTTSRNIYCNRNERGGLYDPPLNKEATPRDDRSSMGRVEDMMLKIMRRFEATDENF